MDRVLNGKVMRSGEQVTVSVELVQPDSERHIWGRSYERDRTDVSLLQSEFARDITIQTSW